MNGEISNRVAAPRLLVKRPPVIQPKKKQKKATASRLGRRASNVAKLSPEALAKVALELFAERHYSAVSIKDIGRAADVNSAMIYYHFEDKRDLFRAAIESAINEAFELFAKHCDAEHYENPAEAIDAWFDVHVALHQQLRNVIKISLDCHGIVGTGSATSEPIIRFYRHENDILQNLIRDGIKRKLFHKVNASVVATMISTALDGVLARSLILRDFDMLRTVREFKQAIWLYLGYDGSKLMGKRVSKARTQPQNFVK